MKAPHLFTASNHHQPHLIRSEAKSCPGQAAKMTCDYAPGLPAKLRRPTAKSRQAQATTNNRLRRTCQYISVLGAGAGLSRAQAVLGPCLLHRRDLPEVGGPTLCHPGRDTAHPLVEHRATQGRSQTPRRATERQAMSGQAAPTHGTPWQTSNINGTRAPIHWQPLSDHSCVRIRTRNSDVNGAPDAETV